MGIVIILLAAILVTLLGTWSIIGGIVGTAIVILAPFVALGIVLGLAIVLGLSSGNRRTLPQSTNRIGV